ncbi:MAG TPA: Crp/Fnr family transcriptional regulator [Candidatus Limnocylindrales bacterium]|nr:Crp/Fnr family transcriptional regulator [Candidatus Limnocylindrales bacterium]
MLKRILERGMPSHEPLPPRTALSDPELKAGLLREVDLFDGLDPDQLKEISRTLPMSTCSVGGLVTSPQEADERLYIVKRGRLRLYRLTPDGRQLTLDILDKGRVFGRMSWLGQEASEVYAEAVEDALVCSFTPAELSRLVDRFPAVGLNIIRYLAERLAVSEREREIMAFRTVEQRLAARLLELAQRFGITSEQGVEIDARLTQQELADMIGTSRETLALTISSLRERHILEMRQQRVVITDPEGLEGLSGE